jgi:hypothetical protein
LRCVVSKDSVRGVLPCPECSVEDLLADGNVFCFSAENMDREVSWLERQDTVEGNNHDKVVSRLRSCKGTIRELLASAKKMAKPKRFIRRRFDLYCDLLVAC